MMELLIMSDPMGGFPGRVASFSVTVYSSCVLPGKAFLSRSVIRECPISSVLFKPADIVQQRTGFSNAKILPGKIKTLSDVDDRFANPSGVLCLQIHIFPNQRIIRCKPADVILKPGPQPGQYGLWLHLGLS